MRWKHFRFREIVAALEWAAAGNAAVHDTGLPLTTGNRTYERTAHLFANDEESLKAAARRVGCQVRWIQRKPNHPGGRLAGRYLTHFDLFGMRLVRAMELCNTEQAA